MQASEIDRIERELEIKLPDAYRKALLSYPIPAYAGNSETMFWDDAGRLIALNLELRNGRSPVDPWPVRFYALGQDDGGCSDALDLDDPEYGVFWFDRQHVDVEASSRSPEKIESWLMRQVKDYTSDLIDAGVDPDQSPEQRERIERENVGKGCSTLMIATIILAMVLLIGIAIGIFARG
jgi:hypothetical protein